MAQGDAVGKARWDTGWPAARRALHGDVEIACDGTMRTPKNRRTSTLAALLLAWSSYTAHRAPDAPPFERGINCFQLARTADGWRIVSIAWTGETATTKLPVDMVDG